MNPAFGSIDLTGPLAATVLANNAHSSHRVAQGGCVFGCLTVPGGCVPFVFEAAPVVRLRTTCWEKLFNSNARADLKGELAELIAIRAQWHARCPESGMYFGLILDGTFRPLAWDEPGKRLWFGNWNAMISPEAGHEVAA